VGGRGDIGDLGLGPDVAAATIDRLLDDDEPARRIVPAIAITKCGLDIGAGELAERAGDRQRLGAGERCGATAFGREHVRRLGADDLVARTAMNGDSDLVAHRAGGQEDGGFLAEELGRHLLQLVGRGVLAALLVADLGLGHGLAHGSRRACLGIAVEIDQSVGSHGTLCARVLTRASWPMLRRRRQRARRMRIPKIAKKRKPGAGPGRKLAHAPLGRAEGVKGRVLPSSAVRHSC